MRIAAVEPVVSPVVGKPDAELADDAAPAPDSASGSTNPGSSATGSPERALLPQPDGDGE